MYYYPEHLIRVKDLKWSRSFLDCVQSAYDSTEAYIPFTKCGCTPDNLSTILQCNALMCALLSFKYLADDKETPLIQESEGSSARVKDIISDIKKRKKRNKCPEYLGNYLLSMVSVPDAKARHFLLPAINVLIEDLEKYYDEKNNKDIRNSSLTAAFHTLYRTSDAYGDVAEDDYSSFDSKQRQQHSRLNSAYSVFYERLSDMVQHVSEPESHVSNKNNAIDRAINELVRELIFHHHALSKCEEDFLVLKDNKDSLSQEKVSNILHSTKEFPT